MLHQPIPTVYFDGDEPAQQAVIGVRDRIIRFADATKYLAEHQFRTPYEAADFRAKVIQWKRDIVSRATSGGVVPSEMDTFWEAALAHARTFRRGLEIYPIVARVQQRSTDPSPASKPKRQKRFVGRGRG